MEAALLQDTHVRTAKGLMDQQPPPETSSDESPRREVRNVWQVLGPGLITGASDDDPSGIATYSQAGAQFGYSLGWTLLFSFPLMCAIQEISGRIGRVTGMGIAGVMRRHYPRPVLWSIVSLLVVANVINLGADLGAMGAGLQLVAGGPRLLYVALFAALSAGLEIFVSLARYEKWLKWLTLSLFTYVAVVFAVHVPWAEIADDLILPRIEWKAAYLTVVVAVLGTTISPYLFFWQAEEEAEDVRGDHDARPLKHAPGQAREQLRRIRIDTWLGMAFSNAVALFIVIATAATLHAHGRTDIQTSAQAAEALRPIAGDAVFFIFALGIIGTGLLAVPVLAGSAAFALGETFAFRAGLAQKPRRAILFYAVIALAFGIGAALNFTPIDPIKALFWTAVINGVVAVPLMVVMMLMSARKAVMGAFVLPLPLKLIGWLATLVMAAAAIAMFATWGQ